MKKFLALAVVVGAALGTNMSSASAQMMMGGPGFYRPLPPRFMPMPPPVMPIAPMIYGQQPSLPPVYAPGPYNPGMGVDLTPVGPYAGAAVTNGLSSLGVPAPIAGWAGGRVAANAESAGREYNPLTAGVKIGTGVSVRDIQQYGPLGGPNSEARKILRFFGG